MADRGCELGESGGQAQLVGVACVDAAEQRGDQGVHHRVAEVAADDLADALVVGLFVDPIVGVTVVEVVDRRIVRAAVGDVVLAVTRRPGPDAVEIAARTGDALGIEDPGGFELVEVQRHTEVLAARERHERVVEPQRRLSGGRRDECVGEVQLGGQVGHVLLAHEERVGPGVDAHAGDLGGQDLAARAVGRFEDDDVDAVGLEGVCGHEAGDAGADDGDRHGRTLWRREWSLWRPSMAPTGGLCGLTRLRLRPDGRARSPPPVRAPSDRCRG